MKIMHKPMKKVKKIIYQGRIQKFRRFIAVMVVGGILASALYFCMFAYSEYATANAHVILNYPEIAESHYPDGSRFTYYDFVSMDRIAEALKVMQDNGKYQTYTVEDLNDSFRVKSYLDTSASSDVAAVRSGGDDFSYVANEYVITFVQPHDYGNPDIIKRLLTQNYSDDFLYALADINKKYIAETKSGKKGFDTITTIGDMSGYDYDEKTKIYKSKIYSIVSYLNDLKSTAPNFVSSEHNVTLGDVSGKYSLIISNQLDAIADFIESSGISKNTEVAVNKLKVNLENDVLKFHKFSSEAGITRYAMNNYDQTFTENLINVVRDDAQGLYQARPKTAFDKVVARNNTAEENVSTFTESINNLNRELARFSSYFSAPSPAPAEGEQPAEEAQPQIVSEEEIKRLSEKCDALFANLDKEYNALTEIARDVVTECLNITNENYMTVEIEKDSIFTTSLAAKLVLVFFAGAIIVFVLCIMISVYADNSELRRKRNLLKKISAEKGV